MWDLSQIFESKIEAEKVQKVSKSLKIASKVLDLRWLNVQNYFRRILALWRCMGLVQADIPDWHYQTHIIILACRARVTILWSHKSSKYVDSRESSSTLLVAFKKVGKCQRSNQVQDWNELCSPLLCVTKYGSGSTQF